MSFGFSVGDFLTVGKLIKDIITSLRHSSVAEYRELTLELHGLQRALDEIEHLQPPPDQEVAVNAVKVAALICQYPLDEFAQKLKKYDGLDDAGDQSSKRRAVFKRVGRKVQWELAIADEVRELRAYLAAHVGSLNLRLITLGLSMTSIQAKAVKEREEEDARSRAEVGDLKREVESYVTVAKTNGSLLSNLYNSVTVLMPQVTSLVELMNKVWSTNTQIMAYLVALQTSSSSIDLQHTWFQTPIKLEDALGRVIPIPSEYNWTKLEAIIQDQFRTGPGHEKVLAGEYELFLTSDSNRVISEAEHGSLTPGASITMGIVIGRYEVWPLNVCPRPGCKSKNLRTSDGGGQICTRCNLWFQLSRKPLPRPFRVFHLRDFERQTREPVQAVEPRPAVGKRKREVESSRLVRNAAVFAQIRNERRWFKNLRIYQTTFLQVMDASVPTSVYRTTHANNWTGSLEMNASSLASLEDTESSPSFSVTVEESRRVGTMSQPRIKRHTPKTNQILSLVAAELDTSMSELHNSMTWEELGMDSLLSLTLLAEMRDILDHRISALTFLDYPTVGELRAHLECVESEGHLDVAALRKLPIVPKSRKRESLHLSLSEEASDDDELVASTIEQQSADIAVHRALEITL